MTIADLVKELLAFPQDLTVVVFKDPNEEYANPVLAMRSKRGLDYYGFKPKSDVPEDRYYLTIDYH